MTEKEIDYYRLNIFKTKLKKLLKRFPSLEDDLEIAKRNVIELYHINHINGIENDSLFPIKGCCNEQFDICKIKKFSCKSLKGTGAYSGIRVIYAIDKNKMEVTFLEIYFKGDQKSEDKKIINDFLKKYS